MPKFPHLNFRQVHNSNQSKLGRRQQVAGGNSHSPLSLAERIFAGYILQSVQRARICSPTLYSWRNIVFNKNNAKLIHNIKAIYNWQAIFNILTQYSVHATVCQYLIISRHVNTYSTLNIEDRHPFNGLLSKTTWLN